MTVKKQNVGNRSAIKRKERYKNSGSLMPDALKTMYALEKVFRCLKEPKLLVTWVYWWLTNQLMDASDPSHELIPPHRVRANEECDAHRIRVFYDGTTSWVEFSMPYLDTKKNQTRWHWQPCPRSLNTLFHAVVSQAPLHTVDESPRPSINDNELIKGLNFVRKKQRRNGKMPSAPTTRKDNLHRYPSLVLRAHPTLDNMTKYYCSRHPHHDSAHCYLSRHVSQIRYALYHAHNSMLERVWKAAHDQQSLSYFKIRTITHHDKSAKLSIESLFRYDEAHYLTENKSAIQQ